ncbi:MAG TPA: hypothetical protein VGX68_24555 [Thermoanaerobaculia bacterium]|nr:hypothetical protein [Thermoanaerobaculia bacterium]
MPSTVKPDLASPPHALKRVRWRALRHLRVGAGTVALVLLIGTGVAHMVHRSSLVLSDARRWAALDLREARRKTFGAAYTDAIQTIRRELPSDATYLLVPRSTPVGWELWIRYDLAPRRPILLQPRAGGGLRGPKGTAVPKWVDWAVVPGDEGVPVLVTRGQLLSGRRAHDAGR